MAALLEMDIKTIHNWVNSGKIPAHRTPGGHLRFYLDEVIAAYRKQKLRPPRNLERAAARAGDAPSVASLLRDIPDAALRAELARRKGGASIDAAKKGTA